MPNYGAVENCIEWLRGTNTVTLSLSDPEVIATVVEMAQKDEAVVIVERNRHTMCAKMPLEYVTFRKPRRRKETNEPSNPGRHTPEAKASRGKGEVLRKRRIPRGTQ